MWTVEGTIDFDRFWQQTSRFRFRFFWLPEYGPYIGKYIGNRPHAGRWDSACTDTNNCIWPLPSTWPVATPNPACPQSSLCTPLTADFVVGLHYARVRWLVSVHYGDCTARKRRVWSKSHYVLLISRFWLHSIVDKVFDFRLRFNYRLIINLT